MGTLVEDLQVELGEAGNSVFWPLTDLYDALNQALLKVWIISKPQYKSASMLISQATPTNFLPVHSILIPQRIIGMEGELQPSEYADFERWREDWKEAQADHNTPTHFIPVDCEKVEVFPSPIEEYIFEVEGVGWPPFIDASSTNPTLERNIREATLALAKAHLVEDHHPDLADMCRAQAATYLKKYSTTAEVVGGRRITKLYPASNPIHRTGRI